MGSIYLVVDGETFKLNRMAKQVMLDLARSNKIDSKTISKRSTILQHVYLNKVQAAVVVKAMVQAVFRRDIGPFELDNTMNNIKELYNSVLSKPFSETANVEIKRMLWLYAGTKHMVRISNMKNNFDLIRALYTSSGFNLKEIVLTDTFCGTKTAFTYQLAATLDGTLIH